LCCSDRGKEESKAKVFAAVRCRDSTASVAIWSPPWRSAESSLIEFKANSNLHRIGMQYTTILIGSNAIRIRIDF
jgi:hypothetical protein